MSDVDPNLTRSFELVEAAQGGDLEAFNRIFERYYERILHIVRIRMGHRMQRYTEAEDILQETFIAAIRTFDRFEMRNESSLVNWLAKLAEHKITEAVDYHHAQKRDRRRDRALEYVRSALSSGTLRLELPAQITLPGERASRRELRALAEECLSELSHDHREVIVLRLFAGGSWEWVAEQMGRPTDAAARELFRRAKLALVTRLRARLRPES